MNNSEVCDACGETFIRFQVIENNTTLDVKFCKHCRNKEKLTGIVTKTHLDMKQKVEDARKAKNMKLLRKLRKSNDKTQAKRK